jgi:hypothetical protein
MLCGIERKNPSTIIIKATPRITGTITTLIPTIIVALTLQSQTTAEANTEEITSIISIINSIIRIISLTNSISTMIIKISKRKEVGIIITIIIIMDLQRREVIDNTKRSLEELKN